MRSIAGIDIIIRYFRDPTTVTGSRKVKADKKEARHFPNVGAAIQYLREVQHAEVVGHMEERLKE